MVYYFSQNATIAAQRPGRSDYETVGAVQEVSIEVNFEDTKLYQYGDIKRCDASRSNMDVPVTINFAKFGKPSADNDWFWAILNGSGWGDACNGRRTVTVTNTTNFPLFKISGEFRPSDGSGENLYIEIIDVYFTSLNWGGAMGEYIIENLTGSGADVIFSNKAPTGWKNEGVEHSVFSPTGALTVEVGDTLDITIANYGVQITGSNHKYTAGTADNSICGFNVNCNTGVFTATGIKAGECTLFAMVDRSVLPIPITVVDP